MADQKPPLADDELLVQYARLKADLTRKRHEVRDLGEYLQEFGKALVERPERILVTKPGMKDTEQDWFLVTRNLPTLQQIQTLALDITNLNRTMQSLGQHLRDRGLPTA